MNRHVRDLMQGGRDLQLCRCISLLSSLAHEVRCVMYMRAPHSFSPRSIAVVSDKWVHRGHDRISITHPIARSTDTPHTPPTLVTCAPSPSAPFSRLIGVIPHFHPILYNLAITSPFSLFLLHSYSGREIIVHGAVLHQPSSIG